MSQVKIKLKLIFFNLGQFSISKPCHPMLIVCVYKYLTSMLEIEWKFFVFVEILEKGDSNAL